MRRKIILIFQFIIWVIYGQSSKKNTISYKCGVDSDQTFSEFLYATPIKKTISILDNRRLDNDGFKKFNIYLDTLNLEEEMKEYNLTHYNSLFIDSMKKAIDTLESLLRVKFTYCYNFRDDDIKEISINYWDKTKIGDEANNNSITSCTNDIDLFIFARLGKDNELSNSTLASAGPKYIDQETGRPIIGIVNINRNVDYSKINSKEYFQSIIIHEFTHILGFLGSFFKDIYHNVFTSIDKFNITRAYINSTKVVEVARKYFNCSDLEGVELEDYGGSGTAGSHWEARILLGDYMNGIIYPEELVISEFTLALLEDSGYYKANYYTGGLMRYGKNKGCKFVRDKCINNYEVEPNFGNEFFDFFNSELGFEQSCSSGRQSRTYFAIFTFGGSIPIYYQYFNNSKWGGFESADYCPVPRELENENRYYVGHCSNKGNGEYGGEIKYIDNNYYKNEELEEITGETYSNHSFCYLSSLTKKSEIKLEIYSNVVRAVCYETFCSPKSLTVKIHDNYIVCPRAGGKIQIDEYGGFFLCPDYNLMCSGTILCNDMFECVEKKSEIKEDAFNYDYKINTTQNIERAKDENIEEKNNYELSDEGICIKYCKQCKENKKCIKCREEYGLVGNKANDELLCLPENELSLGYYKNNESIYYKCIDFCEKCSNDISCEKCMNNFTLTNNTCVWKISNCENYYLNGSCNKCNENYAFEGEVRNICLNKEIFSNNYYTKDGGISFYSCDGEGNEHIHNCNNCYFNGNNLALECIECKNDYFILDDEFNKCYSENELNSNKYYRINSTHKKSCSKQIEKCNECESNEKCTKCEDNYYLINNDTKNCVNINEITPIDEYYLDKNNTTYYSCNNSEYHSVQNCKKCYNNNSCTLCNNGFTFTEGNKTKCFKIEDLENKYYPDPNDITNYESCSKIDPNCLACTLYNICSSCSEGLGLYKNKNLCINISSNEYYKNDLDNLYYSCDIITGCKQCLNNETCITCNEENYTLINNSCLEIASLENKYFKDYNSSKYLLCSEGVDNCETCYSGTECIKCLDKYTKIENISSNCYLISNLSNEYLPDPSDDNNYIKCSNLFNNCYSCNLSQCLSCKEGSIFINDNFSNCISKLSINLDEYYTEDNITYYSCKNEKYKNNSKCFFSINTIYIPIIDTTNPINNSIINDSIIETSIIYSIIRDINSSYLNINDTELIIISTFPSIKTSLPIYSSIISHNDTNTDIIDESYFPLKIYTIFFLQIQLRGNIIYIYIICNFNVTKDFSLTITIIIYESKILRGLQEYEKKEIELKAFPTNKENQNIFEISAEFKNLINPSNKINVEMKDINVDKQGINRTYYDVIIGENNDNKNTEKVEKLIKNGGTNFSKIVNQEINNYKISKYEIEDISEGCNFNLKVNKKIISNRNIILTFMESKRKSNNITAECILSSKNNNEIPCSIDKDTTNSYILKDFIDYNENEIITIISNNKNSTYSIVCNNSEKINFDKYHKGKEKSPSALHIIIIILCFFFVIAIIGILIHLFNKRENTSHLKKESKINLSNIASSTQLN